MAKTISEIKQYLQTTNVVDDYITYLQKNDSRKGVQKLLAKWEKDQVKVQGQTNKLQEMLYYEKQIWQKNEQAFIVGIDEVGRGPLAGPVVACAIIMPKDDYLLTINDSKQLSLKKREQLYIEIMNKALAVGIGIVDVAQIDQINIYEATKVAMQQAIHNLNHQVDYLLIDAMKLPVNIPQESIIKGDAKSYSIASASIVAKVERDRLMADYAKKYPEYAFEKNAGYGTKEHLIALQTYGFTPIHRKSFEPIKSMIKNIKA